MPSFFTGARRLEAGSAYNEHLDEWVREPTYHDHSECRRCTSSRTCVLHWYNGVNSSPATKPTATKSLVALAHSSSTKTAADTASEKSATLSSTDDTTDGDDIDSELDYFDFGGPGEDWNALISILTNIALTLLATVGIFFGIAALHLLVLILFCSPHTLTPWTFWVLTAIYASICLFAYLIGLTMCVANEMIYTEALGIATKTTFEYLWACFWWVGMVALILIFGKWMPLPDLGAWLEMAEPSAEMVMPRGLVVVAQI